MAIVATLVHQGANHLRYLYVSSGAGSAPVITTTGGVTPDLITDTIAGPLRALAKVFTDGFGSFAAGALTQAQARALWLGDTSGANPGLLTLANIKMTGRTNAAELGIDANVSSNHATLTLNGGAGIGAASWYVDIYIPSAIGD